MQCTIERINNFIFGKNEVTVFWITTAELSIFAGQTVGYTNSKNVALIVIFNDGFR